MDLPIDRVAELGRSVIFLSLVYTSLVPYLILQTLFMRTDSTTSIVLNQCKLQGVIL